MKALVEQYAEGSGRRVDLYVGARSRMESLRQRGRSTSWRRRIRGCGWGRTWPVRIRPGRVSRCAHADRVLADGDWRSRHVYVCGLDEMVGHSAAALTGAVPAGSGVSAEGYGGTGTARRGGR
ncbi:hypothetical protein V2I01_37445 [Micromonospora sp. BRA006-A]|nr:hypothetical protein [Micromonospora sp. BRA006-A]